MTNASAVEPHPDGWFVTHDATLDGGDASTSWHQGIKLASEAVLRKRGVSNIAFVYDSPSGSLVAKPPIRVAKWAGEEEHMPYNLFLWGKDTGRRIGDKILIALENMDVLGGDGEVISGVDSPEEALDHLVRRQCTSNAAVFASSPPRLCLKPKGHGGVWSKGMGILYVWVDRFVGPSLYTLAKAQAALAPQFAAFDRGSKEAADVLANLAGFQGDMAVAFGLCCRIVPCWSVDDEVASLEEFNKGQSGGTVIKVQRCAKGEHDTVLFKVDKAHDSSLLAKVLLLGKLNGAVKPAAEAMASSPYFPTVWVHELLDHVVVYEWLAGGDLGDSMMEPIALRTTEDTAALGTAFAQFHSDSSWFNQHTGNKDPLDEARDEIEQLEHGTAMLEALRMSRSDTLLSSFRAASEFGLTPLCRLLPRIASLLAPGSLLGRSVVIHCDAHNGNMMRREPGGRPGDLVLVDFDGVCCAQAAHDFGRYLLPMITPELWGGQGLSYPTLETRKAWAQAYIDALPKDVVDQCSRTSVEELVLDMEAGILLAEGWLILFIRCIMPDEKADTYINRSVEERLEKLVACWEKARSDKDLRDMILEEGIYKAVGEIIPAGEIVRSAFS